MNIFKVFPVVFALVAATPSLADQHANLQPMEKGKATFTAQCTICHDAEKASGKDLDRAGWGAVIDQMAAGGAKVSAEEKGALAAYLAAGSLLRKKCSVCHDVQRPLSKNKGLAQWKSTVTRMSGKRPGHLSDEEIGQIADYLAAERPLK